MKHRITVLGAGYAGGYTAGYLARHLHPDDVQITVVNAEPDFVERLRLHQVAAGQELRRRPLADMFAGAGVQLRVARVDMVDPDHRTVTATGGGGVDRLEYDTLVYALGSAVDDHGAPGVVEHAHHVTTRPAAMRLREHLDALGGTGKVLVVGGNLTAIEAATELAESRPGLQVALATRGELGGWLGPKARRHLRQAFDRFGIAIHEHAAVTEVAANGAIAENGTAFTADATVWAAGFAVHPIAAASGLAVEPNGQVTVDRRMRSVSHPEVYAVGDAAFVVGENGKPLPMSCASAGATSMQAVASVIGDLTGRSPKQTGLSYVGNHISLGRNDAIFQLVDGDARSKPGALLGPPAARVKGAILRTSAWSMGHPTFGMPARRRRVATAADHTRKAVNA
ncbi:FAD-dependent oxidoreductase [Glycomyces sp. TRM65418]|uniref:NAD(P)/FAD-dependent oxidoreductase n=1 Tax=Glycomyces sp. TRM65418 TaxID=2867006 RepID=UPI001CE59C28|nr:FAD-dependent oxidoreductase [Glycomyces sp. TRM65418]MCC3764594.1 FAD-dependent oxidoreductase [Glycomyces sp. TRM65418]QZD54258.1 FAD-dependent oxidoreductase [Glycomyces sp. TRM65418]